LDFGFRIGVGVSKIFAIRGAVKFLDRV
jgi:hypothetical protein